ncbi:MAG: hypothetical protein ACTSRG_13890 [Candidatus Helarchaeota archaeon]
MSKDKNQINFKESDNKFLSVRTSFARKVGYEKFFYFGPVIHADYDLSLSSWENSTTLGQLRFIGSTLVFEAQYPDAFIDTLYIPDQKINPIGIVKLTLNLKKMTDIKKLTLVG